MVEGGDEKMKGLAIYSLIVLSISMLMMLSDLVKGDTGSLLLLIIFVPIEIFFVEFLIRKEYTNLIDYRKGGI